MRRQLRAHHRFEFVVAQHLAARVAHDVDGGLRPQGLRQRREEIAGAVHARQQHKTRQAPGRHRHFHAARKASMTLAELSAAMLMKVPISFSPSPPPARSLSERKAM
ncbi:hypothetical protein D9M68_757490 [compost metagenome]